MALLFAWAAWAGAQLLPLAFFQHQAWSTEEGLPQASVHAILQARDGYLWVATEGGVAQFDGHSFRIFQHENETAFASDDVCCVVQDAAGDLWFGTSAGLIRRRGGSFQRFTEAEGLPANQILALALEHGTVVAKTAAGDALWMRGHFNRTTTQSTADAGLGVTKSWWSADGIGKATAGSAPGAQTIASASWGGREPGAQLIAGAVARRLPMGSVLPGTRLQVDFVDSNAAAWVGTNAGLVYVDAAGHSEEVAALHGDSILALAADREGDIWIGTEASGLHVLRPRIFAWLHGAASNAVTAVATGDQGEMFFGTRDSGLFRYERVISAAGSSQLTSPLILSLAVDHAGGVWAGTPDGLNHVTGRSVTRWTIADGLPDNFVRSVVADQGDAVWAGTRFGLVRLRQGLVTVFTRADGLASDSIGPLLQGRPSGPDSVIWIGTANGLCRRTGEQFQCIPPSAQFQGSISALALDKDGLVWAAAHQHGLGMVRGDRVLPVAGTTLPQDIAGILADDNGFLWIRSPRGVFRASTDALKRCAEDRAKCSHLAVQTFTRSDGLPSEELAGEGSPLLAQGRQGDVWLATRRGVAVTDPQHLAAVSVPPLVAITSLQVDGTEMDVRARPAIEPGHRQYSMEYVALAFNQASSIHYRYRLDGFDAAWVDAGGRRSAVYTNLPARHYAFHVQAANSSGSWSVDDATMEFDVMAPWYRRSWAYALEACALVLLVVGVIQVRVVTERRRYDLLLKERTRVAREVHDTLAQDLVGLSLQVEISAHHAKAGRVDEAAEQLMQTKLLVRQALESARQSIWDLRSNVPDDSLPIRLKDRMKSLRDAGVEVTLNVSGEYRPVPRSFSDEVLRIAGEALQNVERHAAATSVSIRLLYGPQELRLEIRDNGRGFTVDEAKSMTDHYGLRGMQERAAALGGDVSIDSVAGQGTRVEFAAPLKGRTA